MIRYSLTPFSAYLNIKDRALKNAQHKGLSLSCCHIENVDNQFCGCRGFSLGSKYWGDLHAHSIEPVF